MLQWAWDALEHFYRTHFLVGALSSPKWSWHVFTHIIKIVNLQTQPLINSLLIFASLLNNKKILSMLKSSKWTKIVSSRNKKKKILFFFKEWLNGKLLRLAYFLKVHFKIKCFLLKVLSLIIFIFIFLFSKFLNTMFMINVQF